MIMTTTTTRVGIVGYGNIARGAEIALQAADDMELVAIFSRRSGIASASGTPVFTMDQIPSFQDKIDVMILCGGSANDLMEQGLEIGRYFHVIDSFDTHAKIEEHFTGMDRVAKAAGKVALISMGWDPGLFSLMRLLGEAALPHGKNYTFWGRGISQGHSNAIRRIAGVADAKQYTVPKEEYLERARNGEMTKRESKTKSATSKIILKAMKRKFISSRRKNSTATTPLCRTAALFCASAKHSRRKRKS